ncbi:MAG: hypothetical protein CMJ76_13255 [Planctomycetaceae bacterium]|nr:hypothetical protein [Planctomycetaceae bacterium]
MQSTQKSTATASIIESMRNITIVILLILPFGQALAGEDTSAEIEFFEKRIRPVLVTKCYECHSSIASDIKGGLVLDSRNAIRKGGDSGPAVVPGKIADSLLYSALLHDSFEMPPDEKLPQNIINDFKLWIESGAADPRDMPPNAEQLSAQIWEDAFQSRKDLWSFQAPQEYPPPEVSDTNWSKLPIDRFVLKLLSNNGLTPSTSADKTTLIRRLSYILTGLPPTRQEIADFVSDETADAWPAIISHYLSSPHFGERFARHWMDVVRYTDTYGYEWDVPAKGAWRYRDYLIRAFNSDIPFDQLIREQIAGDLLPEPRINKELELIESHIGPMFYQLGEHRHGDSQEFEGIHQEMIDNKVDAFSKAFQAITIACARCHDHKLDPISQNEYYALAGTFMSSRWISRTIDLPRRNAEIKNRLSSAKAELRDLLVKAWIDDVKSNINISALDAIQPATKLPIGDINHPWNEIHKLEDSQIADKWSELRETYRKTDLEAEQYNRIHYILVADFRQGDIEGWFTDGHGIETISKSGEFTVHRGDQFVKSLLLPGVATSRLSTKLNGALRSPLTEEFSGFFLHALTSGGDFSAQRTVIDNAFLCEKQQYYAEDRYSWKTLNLYKEEERKIFLEFTTKTSNPNFPPRWGLGKKLTESMETSPDSWFSVSKIYMAQGPGSPKKRLTAFVQLLESGTPDSKKSAAILYQQWLATMVKVWGEGSATDDQIQVLNNLLQTPWVSKSATDERLKPMVDTYRSLESLIKPPRTVNGLADHDPGKDYRLNVRGSYYELGDPVPRGYLRLFSKAGTDSVAFRSSESGRLELANLVASAKNPLTARVYVNRVWQWLFGTGIVDTPSNFGELGGRPSHPRLLDWLTLRFVDSGWSTKTLVREILLTQTWRQSGKVSAEALRIDPSNRLLHHFATRRLEAEAIGDAMLASAGTLDRRLYGRPHNPFRTAEDEMKRLFSGPVDANRRRMIYTKVTIMEPAKFLATFNSPNPKIPTGARDVTNTPAQALTLLNHPFATEVARQWGEQVLTRKDTEPLARLEAMLERALSRSISSAELSEWESTLFKLANLRNVPENEIMKNQELWSDIAHTIFNTKEFIYLR